MLNLRRKYGPYTWTRTSAGFHQVLGQSLKRGDSVLEFGSSTGHISFKLAREGYPVTLLDIRAEAISEARNNFASARVDARFVVGNFLDHHDSYDLVWNSGLIQCLSAPERRDFIGHATAISRRLLLFYPDTGDGSGKTRGCDASQLPGVGNSVEFAVADLPECFGQYYEKVHWGRLPGPKLDLPFDMHWLLGENPCVLA